ncbi:hypothetical protein SpCBS45565_g00890 [Spizellomyces sp. 'palustris']|nr:hypothetical protein SpCBS45565_g00890 [Spizellomyces sp. 'palustris']
MSYREVRSFTEKMRSLGYPKLVSMESFRSPNFEMVAEILLWLVKSYDPSIDISDDISTEQDRIIFIKSIASFMAPKAHIKLNTRKLYMADGNAVRELLKIASILYEANTVEATESEDTAETPALDISSKLAQLKTCRMLASEITEHGAKLYDLLGKEMELKDIRSSVIARPFELRAMESSVREAITKLQDQIGTTRSGLDNLGADETNLMSKIEKKKVELDRAQKRLQSLQSVRPAYMDEYERIEADLTNLYETYMERFRNLTYLEQQLDEYNRQEQDKFEETEESLKRMQTRLREEELKLLKGDKEMRAVLGSSYVSETASARLSRPKAAGQRSRSLRNLSDTESESDQPMPEDEDDDLSISATDIINGDTFDDEFAGIRDEDGSNDDDDEEDDEEEEEEEYEEGEGVDFGDDERLGMDEASEEDDNDF